MGKGREGGREERKEGKGDLDREGRKGEGEGRQGEGRKGEGEKGERGRVKED